MKTLRFLILLSLMTIGVILADDQAFSQPRAGDTLFRQFILKHHSRQVNGKFAELPLAYKLGMGGPPPCELYNCATEGYCVEIVKRHQQFKLVTEVFWIDAGWFTGCGEWWFNAGNWTVEKLTVRLRGLEPDGNYRLLFEDSGEKVTKTGAELMKGLILECREKPGSLLISYAKKIIEGSMSTR